MVHNEKNFSYVSMKISLLHPSRARPDKAVKTMINWLTKCNTDNFEHILSIDSDDPHPLRYINNFPNHKFFLVNDNKSVVEATNQAAKVSTGDILIYLSDDFDCTNEWDKLIEKEFEGVTKPMILKVDDCLQKFDVAVLTIPIMNRAMYEKLGYFWHPEYKSMFVDEDLYWTANKLGALKLAPHLKFPHNHVSIGKAPDDDTYRRSALNWNQGKAVFARRKAAGFPL